MLSFESDPLKSVLFFFIWLNSLSHSALLCGIDKIYNIISDILEKGHSHRIFLIFPTKHHWISILFSFKRASANLNNCKLQNSVWTSFMLQPTEEKRNWKLVDEILYIYKWCTANLMQVAHFGMFQHFVIKGKLMKGIITGFSGKFFYVVIKIDSFMFNLKGFTAVLVSWSMRISSSSFKLSGLW